MEHPGPKRTAELFAAALACEQRERGQFLDRVCTGDPRLRADLEELLAAEPAAREFLQPPLGVTMPLLRLWQEQQDEAGRLTPGAMLGGHRVIRLLARGGTSEVFEAEPRDQGEPVAIKVFIHAAHDQHEQERFAREARIAMGLAHPHLVQVLSFGTDTELGLPFLVMRLLRGVSLAEVLDRFANTGRAPDAAVRRHLVARFAEVAEGLAALHQRGLMHRDVKPANIMLAGPGDRPPWERAAVLVDLGLVRDVAAVRSTLRLTPAYAAPEHWLDEPVDQRADVFGLGLSMHDVLSGRSAAARLRRKTPRLERLGALIPDLDRDLEAIVALATATTPRWRYAHAGELALDLRAWLAGHPVRARRIRGLRGAWRGVRQHPERVLHYGARGGGLVLLAVILSWLGGLVSNVVAAASAARRALAADALVDLPPALAAIPGWATPVLLPAELQVGARGPDPLAQVVACIGQQGADAGVLLAARYLQRDGLAAHPRLVGFLARALDAVAGDDSGASAGPAEVANRLLFERPDVSAADTEASAPLRRAVLALLARARHPGTMLHCLGALTGCATAAEIPTLLATLESAASTPGVDRLETTRLGLWALSAAVRTSHRRGLAPAPATEVQRLGARIEALVVPQVDANPAHAQRLVGPLEATLCALVRACQRSGSPLPAPQHTGLGSVRLAFLEALLDPAATRAILAAGGVPRHTTAPPEPALDLPLDAYDLGRFAVCLGAPDLSQELRARIVDWARQHAVDPARRLELFDIGWREETARAIGTDPIHTPDPRSRLETGLLPEPSWTPIPDTPGEVLDGFSGAMASWNLALAPCPRAGTAATPTARGCSVEPDELSAAAYLLLLVPGRSEVRLGFSSVPTDKDTVLLHLTMQKNVRQLLPYDGRCEIEVFLDGEPIVRGLTLPGSGTTDITLPLCRPLTPTAHTLALRLGPHSDTTLRVYGAALTLK